MSPITWVEFQTPDVAAATRFLGSVLGWTTSPADGLDHHLITTTAGRGPSGVIRAADAPSSVVYAEVADLGTTIDAARANGGTVVVPPTEFAGVAAFAVVSGPDGTTVGLSQRNVSPAVHPAVLMYESNDDVLERAAEHFAAHAALADRFRTEGALLQIGVFGDPQTEGSMAIFRDRDSAERFVADDPFVRHEVVKRYVIRDWSAR